MATSTIRCWFSHNAVKLLLNALTVLLIAMTMVSPSFGQESKSDDRKTKKPLDLVPPSQIPKYVAEKVKTAPKIDGKLDEPFWKNIKQTRRFVDLISGKKTIHDTRGAIAWDEKNLYIGFWVEEPFVQAKYKKRDSPIYYDNDIEVFIAADDSYYEFELNAHNTIYEAVFIWDDAYDKGKFAKITEFNRSHKRVQPFNGVGYKNHPRGKRTGCFDWDFPGIRTAVNIDGTLNDNKDRDRGWTVELAFPWKGMKVWMGENEKRSVPPKGGDKWKIDLFRFNQYKEAAPAKDSGGWAWARHAVWDSHIPEIFPTVTFSDKLISEVLISEKIKK